MKNDNLVIWNDSYSVQFNRIDDQHKELVRMTNELLGACNRGNNRSDSSFMKTIQAAVNYAKSHFTTEEVYMETVSYPEIQLHKKEHKGFVDEVLRQVKNFEEGKSEPLTFALFLKNWLLNHIAVSDKKYVPFLASIRE